LASLAPAAGFGVVVVVDGGLVAGVPAGQRPQPAGVGRLGGAEQLGEPGGVGARRPVLQVADAEIRLGSVAHGASLALVSAVGSGRG
jgi:hypothetical protein